MDEAPPATAEELPEGRRQWRFRPPPGACELLVVRHGESLPRHPDLPVAMLDGQEDPDLDPRGHDEAERVGVRLAHVGLSAVYVSPLRRTSQTAAPLLRRTGLQPRVVDGLREVRLGEWEGGGWRHEEADRVIAAERWDVIPGAEPNESLEARVRSTLGAIAAAHPDQRVAVFTHGGVIGAALAVATGSRPFAFVGAANGSVSHLVVLGERWLLRRYNDTAHLATDLDNPRDDPLDDPPGTPPEP